MSSPLLTVTASQAGSAGVLALAGEIDLSTSHLLVDAIDAAIASGSTTVRQMARCLHV